MDLRFTQEELEFREEVRSFIRDTLPESTRQKLKQGRSASKEEVVNWQRLLNARGWAVPHWPREWGGTDWSPIKRFILRTEIEQAPAPPVLVFGVYMVGPVIAQFGNESQQRRFLPRIANLDDWWCQGFSEPGAGSDLASLRTSARRQGDRYLVNGQKTWTTLGQHADWIFCLVRTNPKTKKQEGISFLLIDMKSPGVTVRPIITIDGEHEVNEVFFDDVEVPVENLIGEENRGWEYAKYLLNQERTGTARIGQAKERIRHLKYLASLQCQGGGSLIENETFWNRIASVEVQIKAHEITTLRLLALEQQREVQGNDPAASIIKIRGSEILQAISELYLDLAGPYALRAAAAEVAPDSEHEWPDMVVPNYLNWRKFSIYGGSNEIQRNILAKIALEL
ncbi:MAG: pimeloyl-CoA dehydrogenase large subunit [Proteobacteria bacterium]|nr:MAG: pimeloyl-CoA dehydrogenase large subunit [Pseudomonadota bacterium]QKK12345.1 MAG: pimeloyl-CoA dehydrogenase large subunit [Pseudomonadota bacterium]